MIERFGLMVAATLVMSMTQPVFAQSGFACPTPAVEGASSDEISQLLPTDGAFQDLDALSAAVRELQSAGESSGTVVNDLIAAYCPIVAADTGTTDAEKTEEVRQFAVRVMQLAYGPGDDADAIILNVPFPPLVADSIHEKAREAGVTPQFWIRSVVEMALN